MTNPKSFVEEKVEEVKKSDWFHKIYETDDDFPVKEESLMFIESSLTQAIIQGLKLAKEVVGEKVMPKEGEEKDCFNCGLAYETHEIWEGGGSWGAIKPCGGTESFRPEGIGKKLFGTETLSSIDKEINKLENNGK